MLKLEAYGLRGGVMTDGIAVRWRNVQGERVNSIGADQPRRIYNMKITVCIGSSCHIKGSRQVVGQIQKLIAENNLGDKVELGGTFCMGNCQKGVCVTVDNEFFSVTPETVEEFFQQNVKAKV